MRMKAEILAKVSPVIGKPRGWERVVRRILPMEQCGNLPERVVTRDGLRFLANPAIPIGYNVLFFGAYEPELRALLRKVLRPGSVAIDVGANVGWHTLLMANLAGDSGKVFAAEANPSVRERLAANVEMNGLRNVEIVPYAMADRPQVLEFVAPDHASFSAGDGHVVGADDLPDPRTIRVEALTLDHLVMEKRISRWDLLKIDVEGFEWPVLQGGCESIARLRPVVAFEFNASYAVRGEGTEQSFRNYFQELSYEVLALSRVGLRETSSKTWPDCANLVAVPTEAVGGIRQTA